MDDQNRLAPATDGVEILSEVSSNNPNLPPRGELKRKELQAGTMVWVMKTNSIETFVKGLVIAVRDGGELYKVRIDEAGTAIPKLYNSRQLAYRELCNVVIPVGTRIIARCMNRMFAGVVVEVPITTNKERYLIFYDNGYAHYRNHEDIHVVCAQSNDVSKDLPPQLKLFVHRYLDNYPERVLLKLQVNQRIKVEFECDWFDCKVLEVDCSMVQLLFLKSQRKEWLYRGSARLKLLHYELLADMRIANMKRYLQERQQQLDLEKRRNQAVMSELNDLKEEYNQLKTKYTQLELQNRRLNIQEKFLFPVLPNLNTLSQEDEFLYQSPEHVLDSPRRSPVFHFRYRSSSPDCSQSPLHRHVHRSRSRHPIERNREKSPRLSSRNRPQRRKTSDGRSSGEDSP